MIGLKEYSLIQWVKLEPISICFKEFRNDLLLKHYLKKIPFSLGEYLISIQNLSGSNVVIIIAFEQPWVLNWLLNIAKNNLINISVLVFDNSKNKIIRKKIEKVCVRNGIKYFPLPTNNTLHVNRSHGMAMTWIFENVIKVIKPKIFAFIDHDLIPTNPIDLEDKIGNQLCFGRINSRNKSKYWSLWAGYCIFNYSKLKNKQLNFLYDFSRGLDTGGRNWDQIYSKINKNKMSFASRAYYDLSLPFSTKLVKVEVVDDCWIHIGGVSYNNNLSFKLPSVKMIKKMLNTNRSWKSYIVNNY